GLYHFGYALKCSGVIIHNTLILTSAHCLLKAEQSFSIQGRYLTAENVHVAAPPSTFMEVDDITIHDNIALVRVKGDLVEQGGKVAKLPYIPHSYVGTDAQVTGYASNTLGQHEVKVSTATVRVVPDSECNAYNLIFQGI